MDKTDNVVVLDVFRRNRARLVKQQGAFAALIQRSGIRQVCTMHVLHEPVPPPAAKSPDSET
jgi:hypothetical protein